MRVWEAAAAGDVDGVCRLLSSGRANPGEHGSRALRYAAYAGHAAVVRLLLGDARVDPAAKDDAAIWHAARRGHTYVVCMLLADGRACAATRNSRALLDATRAGHVGTVTALVQDPGVCVRSAIEVAVQARRAGVLQVLLQDPRYTASMQHRGRSAPFGVWSPSPDVTRVFLDYGLRDMHPQRSAALLSMVLPSLLANEYGDRRHFHERLRLIAADDRLPLAQLDRALRHGRGDWPPRRVLAAVLLWRRRRAWLHAAARRGIGPEIRGTGIPAATGAPHNPTPRSPVPSCRSRSLC
jgi:hypothetical protein